MLAGGWRLKANALTSAFDWPAFVSQHGADTVLLFGIEPGGKLRVANSRKMKPRSG